MFPGAQARGAIEAAKRLNINTLLHSPCGKISGTLFLCYHGERVHKITAMNNMTKFIAGFLLGSSAGIVAGLLWAPSTGKQTRKKLGKKSKKLAKKMARLVGKEQKFQGAAARRKTGKTPVEV